MVCQGLWEENRRWLLFRLEQRSCRCLLVSIYVGELVEAIVAAPINDFLGRRSVFLSASFCIVVGAIVQVCSFGSDPVFM